MSGPTNPVRVDEITNVWEYLKSVDWTEKWLICLLMFHATCLFIILLLKRYGNVQIFLFGVLLFSVYFSENMNEWASQNWRLFSNEQYFDSNGLFISCVYSTPVLFNCLIMVVMWLYDTASMMSEVRQKKLALKEKYEAKEKQNSIDSTGKLKGTDNQQTSEKNHERSSVLECSEGKDVAAESKKTK